MARVRAGEGVAFLPERTRDAMAIPPDVRLAPVPDLTPERLSVVWPAAATSPAVARFVEHATTAFERHG
ncbi:LysR substrate-binding domain-containing protein [Symbioplanes lichenis]|uniref:LysR substrate-binding domain-containing protein n=1 Tax=Symbioplanes lichenis TaxID=1629072 RepID=UPI00273867D8|nr:LysR substrate-binding domain-containing protein [Actinoplanes lichenis]